MPKSLVEKIAEACRGVDGLVKQGESNGLRYLRILDLANALREKLFDAGVLIFPRDLSSDIEHVAVEDMPGRCISHATVRTEFTVTDGIEELKFSCHGYARDMDGYALATAQTMALKSFLKRLALIFGEYDDFEKFDTEPDGYNLNLADGEKEWGSDIREWPISRSEVIAWGSATRASGYSEKSKKDYLSGTFGVEKISDLKRRHLSQAMQWALATGEKPADAVGNEPS